jgi:hypothetical protein
VYRFGLGRSAPRGRWTRAFGSRIFNPLRWRPPAGGGATYPVRTARAISARAWCVSPFGPEGMFPPSGPDRPRPRPGPPRSADRPEGPSDAGRRTLPARPPPPPARSPAGRPPRWWGESDYGGVLEVRDQIGPMLGLAGRRALNLLGVGWVYARGEKRTEGESAAATVQGSGNLPRPAMQRLRRAGSL